MALPLIVVISTAVTTALRSVAAWVVRAFVIKFILSLGLGFVSYKGWDIALDTIKSNVLQSYNSLPADIISLLNIAGFDTGIGFIFGALSFRVAMKMFNNVEVALGLKS